MKEHKIEWPTEGRAFDNLPVAYTEVDANGTLRVVNPAACRLFQLSAHEMVGRSVWEFVPSDEADRDRAEFQRVVESARNSESEPPIVRRSLYTSRGGFRVHELHRRVIRDREGNPIGISSVTFDVSELEAMNREANQARQWLESAMIGIPQTVIVTDALGFVRYMNPAAERLTGWMSRELIGHQFEKGMPILRSVSKSKKPLSFRMTLSEPWHGDVELLTRERQTVSVWLSASPVLDQKTNSTSGVVIVLGAPRNIARNQFEQAEAAQPEPVASLK